MRAAYIVSAARTPMGKFGGALAGFSAADLGVIAARAALEKAAARDPRSATRVGGTREGFPQGPSSEALRAASFSAELKPRPAKGETSGAKAPPPAMAGADVVAKAPTAAEGGAGFTAGQIEEVIFGCARQAGGGPNVARQIAYRALGPVLGAAAPALTVNQACASGLQAIAIAAERILSGRAECVLAGGTEAMSRVPYLVEGARWGLRLGHQQFTDAMYRDGFLDPLSEMLMGETAEVLAEEYKIPRAEQDAFALRSHLRAAAAWQSGRFRDEVVPVEVEDKKGKRVVEQDETFRADASLEQLGRLPAVFKNGGSVTAGNSSQITDGAAAVVLVSEAKLKEWNLEPLARVVDWAAVGVDPRRMGLGPVPAVEKLAARTKTRLEQYDLVELNEAFAAQVLACEREMKLEAERLNVNGGAIALGHPIGCSGARIVVTLAHELRRRGARRGLATLCVSGGLGMALEMERP